MRITINLNDSILAKVDAEAERLGTSRGAMLTTWIGEKINTLEQTRALMNQLNNEATIRRLWEESKRLSDELNQVQPPLFDADDIGGD